MLCWVVRLAAVHPTLAPPVYSNRTVGHGAMHATALCSEHQKSGASNTPPPAAATVDSIIRYLGGGLYIYQSTNICLEF
jgi:hypothetical protein